MSNPTRTKTAMVLHQIEESLGNFVLKKGNIEALNEGTLQDIHAREMDKGRIFNLASFPARLNNLAM